MENGDRGANLTKIEFWPKMNGLIYIKETKPKSGPRSVVILPLAKILVNFKAHVGLDPESLERDY